MSKILLVEDDPAIRSLYQTALEMAQFTVLIAENGKTGASTALSEKPDLILADLMMPEMNGHEMIEVIRQDDWGKNVKVIFLTNFSDPENVFNSIKLKPEEFIVKAHTDVKDVVNAVRTAVNT